MSTASPAAGDQSSSGVRILQRVFSFPVMLACLLAMLAVMTARNRFYDPDMWWHLKMGEVIWTTHSIPATDLFSWTTYRHAWISHEWLSQLIIYGAWKWGGLSGLMFWLCALAAALLIAGYGLCALYSGNAKVSLLGALTVWLFATVGLAVRPQMIGYLLLIIELLLIQLGRARNPRWFLGLPPLFAIWVNCHGSFFLGIVLAGVFLFSSFFDFQFGSLVSSRWNPHCRRVFMLATILSAGALFLNPIGLKLVLYPLDIMLHLPVNFSSVEEWGPTQFGDMHGIAFLAVAGLCFFIVIIRRSELFFDELLLLVLGIWQAASHVRLLFAFGILAAPVLSRLLATSWEGYDAEQDRIWPNAVMIGISLLVVLWAFPSRQNLQKQVEDHNPVKALEFMRANHLHGRMLNDYNFGGYLIWAAPEYPVFIDGRGDVFEATGVFGDFMDWAMLKSDPDALPNKYGINFCLLSHRSPMARVMPLLRDWKTVYSDDNSVILIRTP